PHPRRAEEGVGRGSERRVLRPVQTVGDLQEPRDGGGERLVGGGHRLRLLVAEHHPGPLRGAGQRGRGALLVGGGEGLEAGGVEDRGAHALTIGRAAPAGPGPPAAGTSCGRARPSSRCTAAATATKAISTTAVVSSTCPQEVAVGSRNS